MYNITGYEFTGHKMFILSKGFSSFQLKESIEALLGGNQAGVFVFTKVEELMISQSS